MEKRTRNALRVAAFAVCSAVAGLCAAQQRADDLPRGYPSKPVRVLVGVPPGSGSDLTIRLVSARLTSRLGQSIVIDNRAGAVGAIAIDLAARSAPDGYTYATISGQNLTAMLLKTVSTDIPNALIPVVQMITQPYLIVVTPSLPVNNLKDFIAYAKGRPLVYASSGVGSVVHLGMEMFKSMAGVDITHIPYKGSGQSMVDLMSGQIHTAVTNSLTATPLVKTGKIRALAVTGSRRSVAFPDLPTVAEGGVRGYELTSWYGLFTPVKTPQPIVEAMNRIVGQIMVMPDVREKLAQDGAEPAQPNTPAEFKAIVTQEVERWDRFLKTSGIRLQ